VGLHGPVANADSYCSHRFPDGKLLSLISFLPTQKEEYLIKRSLYTPLPPNPLQSPPLLVGLGIRGLIEAAAAAFSAASFSAIQPLLKSTTIRCQREPSITQLFEEFLFKLRNRDGNMGDSRPDL
jgi:hypothetical protein